MVVSERIIAAMNKGLIVVDALQIIDSTTVRTHQKVAGAEGGTP